MSRYPVSPAAASASGLTTAQEAIARSMSEAELQSLVTSGTRREPGLCGQLGLTWYHTRNSKGSNSGWPDLVIASPKTRRIMFRELKRLGEKPAPAQQAWLDLLLACGLDAGWWNPADYVRRLIAEELTALAGLKVTRA